MERKTLKDLLIDMTEKTKDITPMKLDVEKLDLFFATKNCLQVCSNIVARFQSVLLPRGKQIAREAL